MTRDEVLKIFDNHIDFARKLGYVVDYKSLYYIGKNFSKGEKRIGFNQREGKFVCINSDFSRCFHDNLTNMLILES